jgi:hypothetical protein
MDAQIIDVAKILLNKLKPFDENVRCIKFFIFKKMLKVSNFFYQ